VPALQHGAEQRTVLHAGGVSGCAVLPASVA
jgi:hypothetical protein